MPRSLRPLAVLVVLVTVAVGCRHVPDNSTAPVVTGSTTTAAESSAPPPEVTRTERLGPGRVALTYLDVTGAERRIEAEVRLPDGQQDAALPAVVWSHGGSDGRRSTDGVGSRWGRAFNEAGLGFVAIAHRGRTATERAALCSAVGAASCDRFDALAWDRPHDVVVVLDWVERAHRALGLDPARLVYGGHSAGAVGALTTAGMAWPLDSRLEPPSDPRPVAFLAASPPGAEARGLSVDSFVAIDRPVLFLTGSGDTTRATDALDRRAGFELLPPSADGALLWVESPAARHAVFDLQVDACVRAGETDARCRRLVRLIADVGTAFAAAATTDDHAEAVAPWLAERFDDVLPEGVTITTAAG